MYLCVLLMFSSKDIGGYLFEYVYNVVNGVNIDFDI